VFPKSCPVDIELEPKDLVLNVGRCLTVKGMHRVLSNAISIVVVIWVAIGGKQLGTRLQGVTVLGKQACCSKQHLFSFQ